MKFYSFFVCILLLFFVDFSSSKPIAKKRGLAAKVIKVVKEVKDALIVGVATIFDPVTEGGSQGACGQYSDKHSMIAALNAHDYGDMTKKSPYCGKRIEITYKGKKAHAIITDACPGCKKGCLDLTVAVWSQLEKDTNKGVIPVSWRVIDD